MLVGTNFKTA
ncbi:unnamed protein product, partial [Adineta ricciae]